MHSDVELLVYCSFTYEFCVVQLISFLFKLNVTNVLLLSLFICSIRLELQPECIPGHG